MKEYLERFYKSKNWQRTRREYLKSVGCLCERCMKKGLHVPAVMVHHKTYITDANANDPTITLSWDNLEALCRDCHEREHSKRKARYRIIDDLGHIEIL